MSTPYNLPDGTTLRDLERDDHVIESDDAAYEKELEKADLDLDLLKNDV